MPRRRIPLEPLPRRLHRRRPRATPQTRNTGPRARRRPDRDDRRASRAGLRAAEKRIQYREIARQLGADLPHGAWRHPGRNSLDPCQDIEEARESSRDGARAPGRDDVGVMVGYSRRKRGKRGCRSSAYLNAAAKFWVSTRQPPRKRKSPVRSPSALRPALKAEVEDLPGGSLSRSCVNSGEKSEQLFADARGLVKSRRIPCWLPSRSCLPRALPTCPASRPGSRRSPRSRSRGRGGCPKPIRQIRRDDVSGADLRV